MDKWKIGQTTLPEELITNLDTLVISTDGKSFPDDWKIVPM